MKKDKNGKEKIKNKLFLRYGDFRLFDKMNEMVSLFGLRSLGNKQFDFDTDF